MKEYRLIITYLVAVLLLLIALICGGCSTTKYVPVETIKRDTVYQSKIEHDSVYLHDSVYVKEWQKGDTVYRDRDRWHTKYVEKELTWWERKKIEFGELAMVVMAGLLCFVVIKSKLK